MKNCITSEKAHNDVRVHVYVHCSTLSLVMYLGNNFDLEPGHMTKALKHDD